MSSGFPGGADIYASKGIGGGSTTTTTTINNGQLQYRSQFQVDGSTPAMLPRRTDAVRNRSLAELERLQLLRQQQRLLLQQQQQQQQQLLGSSFFLRSVKQRSYHHTSPISPLSPVDFHSPEASSNLTFAGRFGLTQHQRPTSQLVNPFNQIKNNNPSCNNPGLSGLSFSNSVPNRTVALESEPDTEKKMRNRLQELEKQLLDDNEEDEGDAASVVTGSEWSETVQNLMNPNQKPVSPSPTSSSSSSSASPSSYSSCSKQSLLDAAAAISEGRTEAALATLARLNQVSNVRGDPEQRLTAYMVSALRSRVNPSENPPPVMELCSEEHMMAMQMLYEVSPCFKLGFMAANLAILEATKDQPNNNVHVVDFDIGQGSQYISLVHALAEQEMNANTAPFVGRVGEACVYYGALFESLDATMPRDAMKRVKVEECLGRKAANTVACEGWERMERCEVFGKWRARMRMAGFEPALGQQVAESMRSRLSSVNRSNPCFTIKEENGGICFGWMGRVLTVASAWR
uniref:Scarecrow-like protein 8 n=1 Tax=Nelumbo nucifera TaxID=4432 RepID=A0A822ZVG9_NELNU|nr:TPA_asm: hypothetical protein HUJ06_017226 [Nelumbo nucifera]